MPHDFPNDADLEQIRRHGLETLTIEKQLGMFRRGASFIRLNRPVSPGDGLVCIPENMISGLDELYRKEAARSRAMSFIPASGAASRMFKLPLAALVGSLPLSIPELEKLADKERGEAAGLITLLRSIDGFAFSGELERPFTANGSSLREMIAAGEIRPILERLVTSDGMNYAGLPKALLAFHTDGDRVRTAMEEHLAEAAYTVRDGDGTCRLHFTVSSAHERLMADHLEEAGGRLEEQFGVRYEVSFSVQKPGTDTVAAGPDNTPFRDDNGDLVFRPGGHGALIENLNDLEGEIVFMKNIDNVVPDRLKGTICRRRTALAGYLVLLDEKIRDLLRRLDKTDDNGTEALVDEAARFMLEELNGTFPPEFSSLPTEQRKTIVTERLNRPLRVCGMVENRGEPGGGPYWVDEPDGTTSLQIVEKEQIDLSDDTQRRILEQSGYFNPVDLVCGLRDFRGHPFDLHRFIDPETFFISEKPHQGRNLRALELPGLWNGAMARWNTVFVEVPIETFNPVKTVLDLLRPQHQPG